MEFRVELEVKTSQKVYYKVEAESREKLETMLETNSVADIGTCLDETPSEFYEEKITDIMEE